MQIGASGREPSPSPMLLQNVWAKESALLAREDEGIGIRAGKCR